ncbi:MAG: hypothetical protein RLZZ293_130 [Pseudomonadota bacterium]|jgi:hypothetical protein
MIQKSISKIFRYILYLIGFIFHDGVYTIVDLQIQAGLLNSLTRNKIRYFNALYPPPEGIGFKACWISKQKFTKF